MTFCDDKSFNDSTPVAVGAARRTMPPYLACGRALHLTHQDDHPTSSMGGNIVASTAGVFTLSDETFLKGPRDGPVDAKNGP